MVYTFDVFDTLITRNIAEPKGVFLLMQEQLCSGDTGEHDITKHICKCFAKFRENAEVEARRFASENGRCEVTLQQIYDAFAYMNNLSKTQIEYLIKLEIETEYAVSLPILENIQLIKKYAENNTVILISDMYLAEAVIRDLLLKHDRIFLEIPLIVSCEYDKSKSRGTLYQVLFEKYKVSTDSWIHYGDNPHSDGMAERMYGGKWIEYKNYCVTERDKSLLAYNKNDINVQYVLGIIKRNRALHMERTLCETIGAEIAAPIVYGYVRWIIENAKRNHIKNLFFIARDGHVLKSVADFIIEKNNLDLNTYYIYGSRWAWRLPASAENEEKLKQWFINDCSFHSILELIEIFDIENQELIQYLPKQLQNFTEWSFSEVNIIKSYLLMQDEFWKKTYKSICKRRDLAIAYLKQEVGQKEHLGFVELNGTGFSIACVKELLKTFSQEDIYAFYYSLWEISDTKTNGCHFMKYSYENDAKVSIIELFFRASHGQTLGYKKEQEKLIPILNNEVKDYSSECEHKTYLDAIMSVVEMMEMEYCSKIDYDAISLAYLNYCKTYSDVEIQEYMGDMPFSSNSFSSEAHSYAPKITCEDMKKMELCKYRGEWRKYISSENLEISLKRSSNEVREKWESFLEKENERLINDYKNICIQGKIALYGAGKYGKQVYEYLLSKEDVDVVLWLDKNYLELNSEHIQSPNTIDPNQFDLILIAVRNMKLRQEIYDELIGAGVPFSKIL